MRITINDVLSAIAEKKRNMVLGDWSGLPDRETQEDWNISFTNDPRNFDKIKTLTKAKFELENLDNARQLIREFQDHFKKPLDLNFPPEARDENLFLVVEVRHMRVPTS